MFLGRVRQVVLALLLAGALGLSCAQSVGCPTPSQETSTGRVEFPVDTLCELHLYLDRSFVLLRLQGDLPGEAWRSVVRECSDETCDMQRSLFLESHARMLDMKAFPQGVHLAVNTSVGSTAGSVWLEWTAVEQGYACPPGTEPLAFIKHVGTTGPHNDSASSPSVADCIAKLRVGQHEGSQDQPLQRDGTSGGFWTHMPADLSGPDEVMLGFTYNWTTDGGNTAVSTDGMPLLSAPGQVPQSFYDHGFSVAASSQHGLISLGVPPGSYSLQFDTPEGANMELSLMYWRSQTATEYRSRNGKEARNLQVQEEDLNMLVVSFSVPPGLANGSCSVVLYRTGPLDQKNEDVLRQVDDRFDSDDDVARISVNMLTGEITVDIPQDGERNRDQPSTRTLLSLPSPSINSIAWSQEALTSAASTHSEIATLSQPALPMSFVFDLDALQWPSSWGKLLLHLLTVMALPLAWLTWRRSQQVVVGKEGPSHKKLQLPVSVDPPSSSESQLSAHSCQPPSNPSPSLHFPPLFLPPIATRSKSTPGTPQLSAAQPSPPPAQLTSHSTHAPFSAASASSPIASSTASLSTALSAPDGYLLSPPSSTSQALLSPSALHPFGADVPFSRSSSVADCLRPSRSSSLRGDEERQAVHGSTEDRPYVTAHVTAVSRAYYPLKKANSKGAGHGTSRLCKEG